ncbi:MAG: KH domain-containing protein [Acidimicrobiia bacterium]
MNEERGEVDDYDDDLEDDDEFDDDDDLDDEIAPEGNRIVGARAQAVVEHVTRQVADDADAIEVEVEERRGEIALLVHANPSDMGRLIGKRGRVIQALRQLVRAAGAAEGVKANVDVVE